MLTSLPRAVLLLVAVFALGSTAGCSSGGGRPGGSEARTGPGGGNETGPGGAADPCAGGSGTSLDPGAVASGVPGQGMPCEKSPCMYHEGSDSYHLCLSRGAGDCFHHGASCVPADRCMYDRASASYRTCERPDDGRCATFGASCEPPALCMYNPADRRHHTCESRGSNGSCTRYGPLCDIP